MKPLNPRSITDAEAPWIEAWIADGHETHRVLFLAVKRFETTRLARSVCSYIGTRAIGEDPGVGSPSKAEYRKILARLADEGVTPPPPRSKKPVSVTPGPYAGERESQGAGGGSVRSTPAPAARSGGRNPVMASIADELATRRRRRSQAGFAQLELPVAALAVMTAAAVVSHVAPQLGAALVDLAPRIDDEDGYVSQADAEETDRLAA